MKKILALLLATLFVVSLASCGKSGGKTNGDETAAGTDAPQTEAETAAEPIAVDISGWNWVKGELSCYDYDYKGQPYYLSYSYPENFNTSDEAYSGFQNFNYFFNPSDAEAKPNNSPYGLYIYFGQGSDGGATSSSLGADVEGGLVERELGGKTVLFGELAPDPNTGSHTFAYYLSYEEDEWSRIWILVCDPEADGQFRKTFEESMSFEK